MHRKTYGDEDEGKPIRTGFQPTDLPTLDTDPNEISSHAGGSSDYSGEGKGSGGSGDHDGSGPASPRYAELDDRHVWKSDVRDDRS